MAKSSKKIGVIGIPGKWSTETLADAIEAKTGFRQVIDMADVSLDLNQNRLLHHGLEKDGAKSNVQDLCQLDALVVKKISAVYSPNTLDRLELLRLAEKAGVRVFSSAENMLRLINRLSCTVTLNNADIPMPDTRVTESIVVAKAVVEEFGSAIFKPLYSTKARGMVVIDASSGMVSVEQAIRNFQKNNPVMYIQRKLDLSGKDLGMVFLANEYLGTYARVSDNNAWNTTIHSGGHYEAYAPNDELIELARRAQAPFDMDYTTVDVAETSQGPVVFEVSAFGGFRGAKEGMGMNVAERYIEHVLAELGSA